MFVMPRISHKSSFKEGNVEYGGVKVDELEKEHFERQIVIKFRLGPVHFCKKRIKVFFISS
jgi:hypothetical protein